MIFVVIINGTKFELRTLILSSENNKVKFIFSINIIWNKKLWLCKLDLRNPSKFDSERRRLRNFCFIDVRMCFKTHDLSPDMDPAQSVLFGSTRGPFILTHGWAFVGMITNNRSIA